MSSELKPLALIKIKSSIPRVSGGLLARPHLIKRLNDGLARKLTLVCAPAGYGKTTLLGQWLADTTTPAAWLTLDQNDNNLDAFLSYFISAIQRVFPEAGQVTLSLLDAPEKPPLDYLSSTLINELAELGGPFLLVLDNYHTITDPEIHQVLDAVITYQPLGMHLVLASRKDFPLPLVRLRIGRESSEFRALDLRLSPMEVGAYLEQSTGLKLSKETVTVLESRTEGWFAALRLAAIAMRGETDYERFVHSFKGSHRDLMEYLVNEALSHQSEDVQDFLLKTSILGRFCAPLAEAVTGESVKQCQEIIEWLEQANLFTVPLDNEQGWYRYHHLFQEMLVHRLQVQQGQEEIRSLHKRAGQWLGQHGFIDEAIGHALSADDVSAAIELIDQHRHELLNQGQWRVLEHWLGLIPDNIAGQDPKLLVLQAWLLLHRLNLGEMKLALEEAERQLDKDPDKYLEASELALRGEIDTMHSYFWNVVGNDPQQGFARAQRALKNLPPTHTYARGMALDFACVADYFSGQKDKAISSLSEAAYNPTHLGPSKLQTFIGLSHLYLISGNLPLLIQTANDFLQMSVENHQWTGIAWARYFIGFVRYEWNELDLATRHLSDVVGLRYGASAIAYKNSLYPLSLAYLNQGEAGKSQQTLDELETYFLELRNNTFLPEIRSVRARLALLEGNLAPAVQWSQVVNPDELRDSPFVFEVQGITWASVRIAQGTTTSLTEAVRHLTKMLAAAEASHNIRWIIRILAYLALAYQALGQKEDAHETLVRSIELAQPGGFIRSFVDLGSEMAWMLRRLGNQGVAVSYIKQILDSFPSDESTQGAMEENPALSVYQQSKTILVNPLTRRESEILLELSKRRTNKEIAEHLTISILTVKKHTGSIYQKLGVSTRGEAVNQSRALGLLPAERVI